MSIKKQLAVFANIAPAEDFLVGNLREVLKNEVEISSCSIDRGLHNVDPTAPVVLTTHAAFYDAARNLYPYSHIIRGEKVLNTLNLEKLILLPKGKRVLVVNAPREAVGETIQNLIDLEIDHLKYVPYYKGETDITDIDTAVSPGMIHLIPESITHKIDIGFRMLSIDSILQILEALDLRKSYLNEFVNQYSSPIVITSKKLAATLEISELARKEQQSILNEIDEGILSIDHNNIIKVANPVAERILSTSKNSIIGRNIDEFVIGKDIPKPADFHLNKVSDKLIRIKNINYLYNVAHITENEESHYVYTIRKVSEIQKQEQKARMELHRKGYVAKYNFQDIWGSNRLVRALKERAIKFANNDQTILITGESGTGKELLAHAIHNNSRRKEGAFVAINFAAIPESLVEAELFGYESGAFTGANTEGRIGLFERAHNGTIFLDEIGDAPWSIQSRLLRTLQEKEIVRVGGSRIIPINVRVIAATNVDLKSCVSNSKFRADLFFRLNVLSLETIPLRNFKEDIPLLAVQYLSKITKENKRDYSFSPKALQMLGRYSWPGNMRELKNAIEYACYVCEGEIIEAEALPSYVLQQQTAKVVTGWDEQVGKRKLPLILKEIEKQILQEKLNRLGTDLDAKKTIATNLGISIATLYNKLRKHKLL
jgi:sigma-54 dependent transcriptional regulator, acetoin dehydrogenase operon transcriptional activator AcoR